MKEFCDNQHCENPAAVVVPVSVAKPSDGNRSLCAACAETYTWGVQHGKSVAQAEAAMPSVAGFLVNTAFVILARNNHDPSAHGPLEAWAYHGPLDLKAATPATFGVGATIADALGALEFQLGSLGLERSPR